MAVVFVSVDVEADGPLPGVHSMLSLGAVAYSEDGPELGAFQSNIAPIEHAVEDHATMVWWAERPAALAAVRRDPRPAAEAMAGFAAWIEKFGQAREAKPVLVAYPCSFDYAWIRWYALAFTGSDPFELRSIDVRSYIMGFSRTDWAGSSLSKLRQGRELPHDALQDARIQGAAFMSHYCARAHIGP